MASGRIEEPALPRSPVVLLLVDFINPLDFAGAAALAPAACAAARACAALRRRCVRRGGAAAELARRLKPRAGDITVLKPRHSAFYATPLDLLLKQLHCKRLIVTGLAADSCVLFSAMDAYLRGQALWVPEDCTAAETEDGKHQALDHMRRVLKADTRAAL